MSVSSNTLWLPGGHTRADCVWRKFFKHTPPGDHCDCGLWSYDDAGPLQRVFHDPTYLLGEIYLWGDVVRHDVGYRSEFGLVAAIFQPKTETARNMARLAAQHYHVPLVGIPSQFSQEVTV